MKTSYRAFLARSITVLLLLCLCIPLTGASRSAPLWALNDTLTEFDAVLWTTPAQARADQETIIDVSIRYGVGYGRNTTPGDPVKNLQTLYDRTIELFVISENLHHFARLRPEQFSSVPVYAKETATFQLRHRFPWGGRYRAVVTFAHRGSVYHKQFDLLVEGKDMPPKGPPDLSRQRVFESAPYAATSEPMSRVYEVSLELDPAHPQPGQEIELRYQVHDVRNQPIRNLQVFEGTEMRVAFVRDDLDFFGTEDPQVVEDPALIPIVPRIATKMLYGRGVLREVLPDGRVVIDHGPILDLVSIAGTLRFRVADPDAHQKVAPGDWVEFWLKNEPRIGMLITRIEPISSQAAPRHRDSIRPSPNHPIFPGPVVPIRHVFPARGHYVVYGQFMHENHVVTTRFSIEVGKPDVTQTPVLDIQEGQHLSRSRLTKQELNGMRIYNSSSSHSNQPIDMRIRDGQLFPANTVTCASCHSSDGRGRREGGAVAVDIRHDTITKPYVRTTESGRTRSPYSDLLLKRAIVEGVDSDGHILDFTMPRWHMSDIDLEDLIAYLHRLGSVNASGVTTDTVRIGTVLDLSGPLAKTGAAVRHVLERVFENVNQGKKVYGRSIELIVGDGRNDQVRSLEAAKRLVQEEQVLAFVGNLGDAATRHVIPYLEAQGIPLIAPLAPALQYEDLGANYVFSIYPTLGYQARILIDHAVRQDRPSIAVLYSDDSFGRAGLSAAQDQLALHDVTAVAEIAHQFGRLDTEKVAAQLNESGAQVVLFLTGDPSVVDLIAAADRLSHSPIYMGHNLLINGAMLQIPRAGERLVFSQNIRFGGPEHPLAAEFNNILKTSPGSARERVIQFPAFAAAKVLVEGLRNAGKSLTRESVVKGLERVHLDTGVLGIIRFSQENHEGPAGISLVKPDSLLKMFSPIAHRREPLSSNLHLTN
ncbi:MAG TPA: c-type cytochrome [Nitrospirales bacterium]|nr:c-type cytochrome [Nitrospirales bacterium]